MRYSLIVDYSVWGKGKSHIAKEHDTVISLCGKDLGFNYSPASVSTSEHDELMLFSIDEIKSKPNVCKSCMGTLLKNGN